MDSIIFTIPDKLVSTQTSSDLFLSLSLLKSKDSWRISEVWTGNLNWTVLSEPGINTWSTQVHQSVYKTQKTSILNNWYEKKDDLPIHGTTVRELEHALIAKYGNDHKVVDALLGVLQTLR